MNSSANKGHMYSLLANVCFSFGQLYSFPARRGLFSFTFAGLTNTGKRPLPWVEIHCVEHVRALFSDRILT